MFEPITYQSSRHEQPSAAGPKHGLGLVQHVHMSDRDPASTRGGSSLQFSLFGLVVLGSVLDL